MIRRKIGGFIMFLVAIVCLLLAFWLVHLAIHAEKVVKIALLLFGAMELIITSIFTFGVAKSFVTE